MPPSRLYVLTARMGAWGSGVLENDADLEVALLLLQRLGADVPENLLGKRGPAGCYNVITTMRQRAGAGGVGVLISRHTPEEVSPPFH
jgi:hypothetical protein